MFRPVQLSPCNILEYVFLEFVLVPTHELLTVISLRDVEFSGTLRVLSCCDSRSGAGV